MLQLANVAVRDTYVAELTLESPQGGRLAYLVANASVFVEFKPIRELGGSETAEWTAEQLYTPQTGTIDRISAVRFRNAVPGSPARVVCTLSEPGDILPAAGTPFTTTLQAAGGTTSLVGVPVGCIAAFGGIADPIGWLICDGRAISRTVYADLFAALGTAYGAGDGSTTFNIPDLRGRSPVGVGTHADVSARGNNEGAGVGARRPTHRSSIADPTHGHTIIGGQGNSGAAVTANNQAINNINLNTAAAAATGITAGPQTGLETIDTAAYQVANFIIATGI